MLFIDNMSYVESTTNVYYYLIFYSMIDSIRFFHRQMSSFSSRICSQYADYKCLTLYQLMTTEISETDGVLRCN